MGTLESWQVVDANNNAAPPDGWPENTMNYSDVNDTGRAVQGTMKRFFADINGTLVAGGVADAYTLTLNETGYTAYFDGMMFSCTIPDANATTTPTMDVNGIGVTTIVDNLGGALGIEALVGGGVYTFQHDGTNLRLVTGGIAVNGATGEFLINQDGRIDAPGNLTYDAGDDIVVSDPSLRVAEWIELNEQSAYTGPTVAGRGYLWVRDDAPSTLIFRDDAGNDTQLGAGGGGGTPALPFNSVQFNNAGAFGGDADLTWNGTTLSVLQDGITACLGVNGTNVLNGNVVSITGDPTTGRVMLLTSTGLGEALRVSGGSPAIEIVSGGMDVLGGASISMEDGQGTTTLAQDGTNEFRITSGLDAGDMRLRNSEPGGELYFTHRDGADLFTRESARFNAFSVVLNASGVEVVNITTTDVNINRPVNLSDSNAGQIQFPATQNPSANANTLDDYEEGDFTASFTATGSGTITIDPGNDQLSYTKIGRVVHIFGEISVQSVSSPTGNVRVNNLPYATRDASDLSQDQATVPVWVENLSGGPSTTSPQKCRIDRGITFVQISGNDDSNIADNFQVATVVQLDFTYFADD